MFHKFLHHKHAIYNRPFRYKLVLEGLLSGAFAGLTAIALRLLLSRADSLRTQAIAWFAARSAWSPLLFLCLLGIAALVTLLLKWEPYISGSGIPQLEAEMEGHIEQKWWRVLLAKFLGSALAIGAGLSLGREGPSIQLGAMAGKGTAEITRDREDSRLIMTFGACAGLSAAFNAPFAGVLFALEEVQKRFSADVLVSAMAASIAANLLSVALVGAAPVFDLGTVNVMPLSHLWLMPLLGAFLGCIGALYNRCIALSQNLYAHVRNRYLRTAIPFVLAGILALTAPKVLGSGHELVAETGAGMAIGTLLFLLAAKFLFSMASFGSGVPGGIFLPLLVLGALSGGIFAPWSPVHRHFQRLPRQFRDSRHGWHFCRHRTRPHHRHHSHLRNDRQLFPIFEHFVGRLVRLSGGRRLACPTHLRATARAHAQQPKTLKIARHRMNTHTESFISRHMACFDAFFPEPAGGI